MKSQNDFPYALLLLIPAYFYYFFTEQEISKREYKRARNKDDTGCFFWPGLVKNFPGEENKLLIAERNSGDQL